MSQGQTKPRGSECRRAAPRQSVVQGAIIHAADCAPVKCVVRNRSDGGAQLIVGDPGGVPAAFDLCIGREAPRACTVAWRRHGVVGVAFEAEPAESPVHAESSESVPAPNSDRRRGHRRSALLGGMIAFKGGHCTMPCRIVDISETGARLRPLAPQACPDEFTLILGGNQRRRCFRVRRIGEDIGVRFLSGTDDR